MPSLMPTMSKKPAEAAIVLSASGLQHVSGRDTIAAAGAMGAGDDGAGGWLRRLLWPLGLFRFPRLLECVLRRLNRVLDLGGHRRSEDPPGGNHDAQHSAEDPHWFPFFFSSPNGDCSVPSSLMSSGMSWDSPGLCR